MLVLVYIFCCVDIAKQQKITILNLDEGTTFVHDVNSGGSKFFKVYQILAIMSPFFWSFLPSFFYHVKTRLWMIIMESKILMV